MTITPRLFPTVLLPALLAVACGDEPAPGNLDAGDTAEDAGRELPDRPETGPADVAPEVAPDVANQPPIAEAGDDFAGSAGRPVVFDGSASVDPDGAIVRWEWQTGTGATVTGETAAFTYPAPGVYVATLTVTDNLGATDTDLVTIDLVDPNGAPVAIIRRDFEGPVIEDEEFRFVATDSSDDIAIAQYLWDAGVEGEAEIEGAVLDYTWYDWGTYTLTLTVIDTDGAADTESRDIDVLARPIGIIDAPVTAYVGQEVVFDATASYDPDNTDPGAIRSYGWDFDDGSPTAPGPLPRHAFAAEGAYDVELTVVDVDGLEAKTVHKITIEPVPNVPPTAVARADLAPEGSGEFAVPGCTEITFSAADSIDPDDPAGPVSFEWDFGDGTALPGELVTKTYRATGVYTVTLTVTDADGTEDTAVLIVTVENTPPTASFSVAPLPIPLGSIASFDASASTDCEGAIARYRWTWGDSTLGSVATPITNKTYGAAGLYTVELEVEDADGATATVTRVVEVVEDVDPPDFSDVWTLDQTVNYRCAFSLVSINFSTVTVADTNPTIRVQSTSGQPGSMSGRWNTMSPTRFDVANSILGGCDENYAFTGIVEAPDRIRYLFTADFVGSCFGCVYQSWSGTMTR